MYWIIRSTGYARQFVKSNHIWKTNEITRAHFVSDDTNLSVPIRIVSRTLFIIIEVRRKNNLPFATCARKYINNESRISKILGSCPDPKFTKIIHRTYSKIQNRFPNAASLLERKKILHLLATSTTEIRSRRSHYLSRESSETNPRVNTVIYNRGRRIWPQ